MYFKTLLNTSLRGPPVEVKPEPTSSREMLHSIKLTILLFCNFSYSQKMKKNSLKNNLRTICRTVSWLQMNKKCFRFFLTHPFFFLQSLTMGKHVSLEIQQKNVTLKELNWSFAAVARHLKSPKNTTARQKRFSVIKKEGWTTTKVIETSRKFDCEKS